MSLNWRNSSPNDFPTSVLYTWVTSSICERSSSKLMDSKSDKKPNIFVILSYTQVLLCSSFERQSKTLLQVFTLNFLRLAKICPIRTSFFKKSFRFSPSWLHHLRLVLQQIYQLFVLFHLTECLPSFVSQKK